MRILKLSTLPFCLCALLLLGACRSGPVYNVNLAPIPTGQAEKRPTMDQIQKAIVMAGAGLGWNMSIQKPGHIVASISLRKHQATVDITYNETEYNITYKNSVNLDYKGSTIHSNYNGWVQNLDNAIKRNLVSEAYK
jgi:uncharacterized lipoprotein YmbA